MKKEYDFSKMKSFKNPFAERLKKQITIRLDDKAVSYFKKLADERKIPYQTLINSYLVDCANKQLKPQTVWKQI